MILECVELKKAYLKPFSYSIFSKIYLQAPAWSNVSLQIGTMTKTRRFDKSVKQRPRGCDKESI